MEEDLLSGIFDDIDSPRRKNDKSEREKQLEQSVLGGHDNFEEALNKSRHAHVYSEDLAEDVILQTTPAWHDEDDEDNIVQVKKRRTYKRFRTADESQLPASLLSKRLRDEFEKNLPTPSWANRQRTVSEDENALTSLATSTGSYRRNRSEAPPVKGFRFKRVVNLNFEEPAKAIVHALEFHPTAQIALVASFGRSATLFQVDGKTNPKLKSVFFEKFPISCAHFLDAGKEFLVCSKIHSHMYYFDLPAEKTVKIPWNKAMREESFKTFVVSPDFQFMAFPGKVGNIHLFSAASKEWIATLRTNGPVTSLAFSGDSEQLYSVGDGDRVYVWNVKSQRCITVFQDDGCVAATTVAVSPSDAYVAVGSNTGVINLYSKKDCLISKSPRPAKTILNLTRSVTSLRFNPSSELLAMTEMGGDGQKYGSVKLFSVQEKQVIADFPEKNNRIRQPEIVDFSLNSGFMGIGNNKGEALLYRLLHYNTY